MIFDSRPTSIYIGIRCMIVAGRLRIPSLANNLFPLSNCSQKYLLCTVDHHISYILFYVITPNQPDLQLHVLLVH